MKQLPLQCLSIATENDIPRQAFLFWKDSKCLRWLIYSEKTMEVTERKLYGRPTRKLQSLNGAQLY